MKFMVTVLLLVTANIVVMSKAFPFTEDYARAHKIVQPCLQKYLDLYWEERNKGKNYPIYKTIAIIKGKMTNPKHVGECKNDYMSKIVVLNHKSFKKLSEIQRKALVIHELAHCFANKQHVEEKLEDECPASIMNPYNIKSSCLEKHWDDYMSKLFLRREE